MMRDRSCSVWILVVLSPLLVAAALLSFTTRGETATEDEAPRILDIQRRGSELVVRASVPTGVARVLLEGCRRDDLRAWVPRAVIRVVAGETEAMFRIPLEAGLEMFRVRADRTDPLPLAYYAGTTNFPGEPAGAGPGGFRSDAAGPPEGDGGAASREVVESDIYAVRGDTLFFFNQFRGLQVIDIANPDAPRVRGTFPLPGMGEQMYLLQDRYAVLLAHDPCSQWGVEAESAVILVDTESVPPLELARLPIPGRIVESRLVGTALYVATETWKPADNDAGAWTSGTWVASFNLTDVSHPTPREPLWFRGSGNVVTATDRFLFVAIADYSSTWPWKTDLQIVDISSPDGSMASFASIPLAGRVPDKFKIDLLDDVLRIVVEATETASSARWLTVLETFRLADPRSAAPVAVVPLDRLELAHGERLFATRFDGARAYIVTFERIDPLWVIDLSNPEALAIAGELEIPGWSTYIRPMGDRLLALGFDDARGSRVAVQLFNVADAAHPTLLAKVPLGENGSWSEATQDEKALGVFPEDGLLLVPLSDWNNATGRSGVQVIDFTRDSLTRRGFLESPSLVPRRAALHDERLLAVSGRELITADLRNRDEPAVRATVELAYPVERVLVTPNHLLEFAGTSARVRPLEGEPGASTSTLVDLGKLPVIGATLRGPYLHLIQGLPATVSWEQDAPSGSWSAHTNAGLVSVSVWDASALPALTKLGEATTDTDQTWLSDQQPFWLEEKLLVWTTAGNSWSPWWWWGGPYWRDVAAPGRFAGPVADFWGPWWYGGSRELIAVGTSNPGAPKILSRTQLGNGADAAGEVFAHGLLLFSSRQRLESEVTGTNAVVETVWVPGDETTAGGSNEPGGSADSKGEWRRVTNSYPIVRWWSKYDLDVADFSGDPARPVIRPPVAIPGTLRGVSREGSLLHTTATRAAAGSDAQQTWLEASAYDGVEVHLIDSIVIADLNSSESQAVAAYEDIAYVVRGGWATNAQQRLEVWRIDPAGHWQSGVTRELAAAPGEIRIFGDLLLTRSGGVLNLFGIAAPSEPEPLSILPMPGCFDGDLNRASGDSAHGLWLPLGDYGAVRIGP